MSQNLIVGLFNVLSSCGFREQVVQKVAFQPPKVSYVLKPVKNISKQKKEQEILESDLKVQRQNHSLEEIKVHRVSCLTTLLEPRMYAQESVQQYQRQKSQLLDDDFFTEILKDSQIKNLIHEFNKTPRQSEQNPRQSSQFDIDIENCRLTIDEEIDTNNIIQQQLTESISIRISAAYEKYYKPRHQKQYPLYEIFLQSKNNEMIEIEKQENLNINGYILKGRSQECNASLFIEIEDKKNDYVLLFSHGNSSDLGMMLDTYLDLAYNLNINVFAYEYSGYGQSDGKCTDLNVIRNIKTAYRFLTEELKIQPTKIIVYGYSIGSGPSVSLAAMENYPIGGLVIHSGLGSGLRVVDKNLKQTPYYDFFPNIDMMKNVNCPVYIMHGTKDTKIPYEHAVMLSKNCVRLHALWTVENAGHCGIEREQKYKIKYFAKLQSFIELIQMENIKIPNPELLQRNKASKLFTSNIIKHYYSKINNCSQSSLKTESEDQEEQQIDIDQICLNTLK